MTTHAAQRKNVYFSFFQNCYFGNLVFCFWTSIFEDLYIIAQLRDRKNDSVFAFVYKDFMSWWITMGCVLIGDRETHRTPEEFAEFSGQA